MTIAEPISHASASINNMPLRGYVKQTLENYFLHLDGQAPANLYNMVMEEVEVPLLTTVLQYVKGNQCKAAAMLGISRGTLRKKLKFYNIE